MELFELYPNSLSFITMPVKTIDLKTLAIIFMHAVLSIIGGVLMTFGYQKDQTSFIAVFEYSFLFFATFWAYIFFSDYISVSIVLGMTVIVLSGLIISMARNQSKIHEQ